MTNKYINITVGTKVRANYYENGRFKYDYEATITKKLPGLKVELKWKDKDKTQRVKHISEITSNHVTQIFQVTLFL